MALSQKSVPTLETEASFLKSWDLPSTRNAIPRSLSDKKKPYMFLEMAGQKVKKEVEPLVFVTDGLDNKDDIHDISINLETDRRFNIDEEIMMKQAPLPYLHYRNEKKIFHTPFKWIFNQAQTQQINSESFYVIREVVVSDDTGAKQGDRYYQIQPDGLKIEEMREQIDTAFQLYWKLTMYNRIRTNFSVEINNLQKSLQEVFRKISIEEDYNYDSNSYILFTNNNIDEQTYKEYYSLLEPMISTKMIPVLAKLKNELYAMAYLSGEYNDIRTALNLFLHNLNQTIAISGMMKKTADKISTLSFLGLREELELAKLQNPQDLYKSFQEISVRIQALTHDANRFSKLRIGFRTYLKVAVILDIYLSNEYKLIELKKKLCVINEQLSQKAQQMKEKGYLRRIGSISAGPDYFIEDFDIDFKSILEGSQCLDQSTVREMKDHTQRVESFVKLAEIFCEEIKSTKDHVKVFKMHYDSVLYLQQVEQVLRGISLAKDIKEKLDPMLEEQEEGSESLQQDLVRQFEKDNRELAFQIRQSSCSTDNQSWCSPKVAAALMKALDQELQGKKGNKGQIKAVTFGKRKMFGKLAKIIRRRTRQKNKIYISCRKRVYSQIKIRDAFEFLKSKRLWRAVSSEKSCMISVQGNIEGRKKAVNHKIYCNSELEMNLMKIIRVFVFFLADAMPTV